MDTAAYIGSPGEFAILLVLSILATWRVSHLLAYEDGPGDIIVRVRRRLGDGPLGSLMDCLNCVSFWVAAPTAFLVAHSVTLWVLSWLAISGGACVLQRLIEKPATQPTEGADDVLR